MQIFFLIVIQLWVLAGAHAEEGKFKIGFIAALSGPAQAYGTAARNGFQWALEKSGDTSIRVLYEDDQFVPAKTVAAFNKLTQLDQVDVVISVGSATSNAIAPLAEARGVPLISWASDSRASKGRRFVIRSYPSGEIEGLHAGQEAQRRLFKEIGVIWAAHDYPVSWHAGLISAFPAGSVVFEEEVPPDLRNFQPILLKARQKGVKDFIICMMPGQVGAFAKQASELGFRPKTGGCEFLQDEQEAIAAQGALRGAWYIEVPTLPGFAAEYKKQYGTENALAGAAIHYDLFQVLLRALKEEPGRPVIEALIDIKHFEGVTGSVSIVAESGDRYFNYRLAAKEIGDY